MRNGVTRTPILVVEGGKLASHDGSGGCQDISILCLFEPFVTLRFL